MEFVVPQMLWWLALPAALLAAYAWAQSRRARDAVRFSSVALLRAATAGRPSTAGRRHLPPMIVLAGVAVAIVALARPAVRTPLPKERATIVLVIDVSGSMASGDMFPSRLAAAKRAAKMFVDTLPADFRLGVVAFSSQATLVQPVTDDHAAVRAAIDKLQIGGATAIGDGLQVALAALPPAQPAAPAAPATGAVPAGAPPPPPPGIVLLLTDGENTDGTPPLEAAQKARDANVPVFTIGIGGRGGLFGTGGRGGVDEQLLREMAAQTGGQYYYAPSGGDLRRVYNDLGLALGWDWQRREIGHYFAGGALALLTGGLGLAFLWLHRQP